MKQQISVHVVIVKMATEDISPIVKPKDVETFQTLKFQISIPMKGAGVIEVIKGGTSLENLNKEKG